MQLRKLRWLIWLTIGLRLLAQTVANPTMTPTGGPYSGTQSVVVATTTPGAKICISLWGATPTAPTAGTCPLDEIGHSTLYTGPITVDHSNQIQAIGTLTGFTNSAVVTAAYTLPVVVNFSPGSTIIQPGFFSSQGNATTLANTGGSGLIKDGIGMDQTKFGVDMSQVYATGTPNWGNVDAWISRLTAAKLKATAFIVNTPPSLGTPACVQPSSNSTWATLAATVVAHIDASGYSVTQYEIWNEPDGSTFCPSSGTQLADYLALYAAAAPVMKAQAIADGKTIVIGGPDLGAPGTNMATWMPSFLSGSTASNVDFTSYHMYPTGQFNITAGMQWPDLFEITQDAAHGLFFFYKQFDTLVRAGSQPSPSTTPIRITEYNSNNAFALSCCQNISPYAQLWNSVATIDWLNTVYQGATLPPSQAVYFAANAVGNHFCLVGDFISGDDCGSTAFNPTPQFFAYKLFVHPNYLNLQAGATMATAVTPNSSAVGIQATAFITSSSESLVISNPTQASYSIPVTLNNVGFTNAANVTYLLNATNPTISNSTSVLTPISGGFTTTLTVPALSTVALKLTPISTPVNHWFGHVNIRGPGIQIF